jgi:hypothetical protein
MKGPSWQFNSLFDKRKMNVPEKNCFWNHIRFSLTESLFCVSFEIFRSFVFEFGIIMFLYLVQSVKDGVGAVRDRFFVVNSALPSLN